MQHDLISLSEQFPGLTVSVSLEDLLSAGRTLSAEIIDYIAQNRDEVLTSTKEKEELLTREETCKRLGISETTLWRWALNGYLIPIKIGVQVRYKLSDINAFISKKGGAQ